MTEERRRGPLFKVGDAVAFETKWGELTGTVEIVDYRGWAPRAYKGCDWSYDIFVGESPAYEGEPCLYKHIKECDVKGVRLISRRPPRNRRAEGRGRLSGQ